MTLDDEARTELAALEANHRLRGERVISGTQGPTVVIDGREVINMASNDYLGLAGDVRIADAMRAAIEHCGVGVGSSRLIVGNHEEHVALEAAVMEWLRVDGVRTFSSGCAANVGVLGTLLRAGDVVVSDELNHASIIDGCRLSKATIIVVPHRDIGAVERALASTSGRRIVVTESLFSMDGDIADLAALSAIVRRASAHLFVDEAHAMGVFGDEGRGLCAEAGIVPDVLVGTFGKALGTVGAFVATTKAVADLVWNRARSFVFSTGTAPSISAATREAIAIVRGADGDHRRRVVMQHARSLRTIAGVPSLITGDSRSPIAPWILGDDRRAMTASARLLDEGIFAQGIRPPTVPVGTARIRFGLSAGHTSQHLERTQRAVQNECST